MGQAKNRGTYEQRVQQAQERMGEQQRLAMERRILMRAAIDEGRRRFKARQEAKLSAMGTVTIATDNGPDGEIPK